MREPEPWPSVFMNLARDMAARSRDPSSQFGACVVGEGNRVLGLGFNGAPPQLVDSLVPWGSRPDKYAYVIHAEENAILAALDGYGAERVRGSTLYVSGYPCSGCVLRAIRAGITHVVWDDRAPLPRCVDAADRQRTADILAALKPGCFVRLLTLSDALKPGGA